MAKAKKKQQKKKRSSEELPMKSKLSVLALLWFGMLFPVFMVYIMVPHEGSDKLPPIEELENPRTDEATLVYSTNGEVLGSFYLHNRTKVEFDELSPFLVNALVSTEDERYFEHSGIDLRALSRAVVSLGTKGGGSTISQQLAKMMFHKRPKRKWGRIKQKFAEWKIAIELEKRYTKEEILAMYFNEFDFLNTAVGVHAASRVYFDCEPIDLKVQEAAMLVGMAKSPVLYSPVRKPENALKRRNQVMFQMVRNGKLERSAYDSIKEMPIELKFEPETQNTGLAPYFRSEVAMQVKDILKRGGFKNEYNEPMNLYRDGLKIYTTIDSRMQKHAEWAVERHLGGELQKAFDKNVSKYKKAPFANNVSSKTISNSMARAIKYSDRMRNMKKGGYSEEEIMRSFDVEREMKVFAWDGDDYEKTLTMTPRDSILYYKQILRVGLVSIEPQTGFVKAWVGGPNFRYFKYDHAKKAKRQVGSTIKPFVYAAALEQNVFAENPMDAACMEVPNVQYCVDYAYGSETKKWCPGGDKYDGVMTPLYCGLAGSKNNVTAKVIAASGGDNARVLRYFRTMGMENSTMEAVPSLGLGVCDVSVMDMTAAHSIFSNQGTYIEPTFIIRIEDKNGKVLFEANPKIEEVVNPFAAFEVLKIMKGVTGVNRPADGKMFGTARRLKSGKPYAFGYKMAGKTGTTQENTDGWFIGHTPDLVTGVWVGAEDRGVHFSSTALGQGANTSLPIWGYYMGKVYKDRKIKINRGDFDPPYEGYPTEIKCKSQVEEEDPWNL